MTPARLALLAASSLAMGFAMSPALAAPGSAYLGMKDGGPRYVVPSGAHGPAAQSGLFAVDTGTLFPVGAGAQSPVVTGGTRQFTPAYLVEFWRAFPRATTPESDPSTRAPGATGKRPIIVAGGAAGVPAAEIARLSTQAEKALDLVMAHPWLADPKGHQVLYSKSYTVNRDEAGNLAYGFVLDVRAWPIKLGGGSKQRSDGRWIAPSGGEAPGLTICSNCYDRLRYEKVVGAYKGVQLLDRDRASAVFLADGADVMQGIGPAAIAGPKASVFAGRPSSDIRFIVARVGMDSAASGELARGRLHPMSGYGKLIGALFLTPFQQFVGR